MAGARVPLVGVSRSDVGRRVKNLEAHAAHGATRYLPFKANTTCRGGTDLWRRMWGYYQFRRDDFLAHYHKRSNVESTIGAIKARLGGRLLSKTTVGQINEALTKVLCHNLVVVGQSIHELGITATFWEAVAS